jgi:hypothetical protein
VIVIVNCAFVVKPESNPPEAPLVAARYVQGAANDDCVTEWATVTASENQKVTVEPLEAVMLAGWKVSVFPKATSTLKWPGVSAGADGAAPDAAFVVDGVVADEAGAELDEEESPPPYPY